MASQITASGKPMILIDLSRDIEHKMQVLPNHPQVIVTTFATHDEVRTVDGYGFSSATMAIVMGDHAGTHVDAPKHFNADPRAASIDEVPLENFFTEAVCLDLSHKPLKSDISIEDLEKADRSCGRRDQAEGHGAAAHGLLPADARHAGLHHRLSGADQGVGHLARARRASACSASRR